MGAAFRASIAALATLGLSAGMGMATESGVTVASQMKGLEIVRLDRLPRAPKKSPDREFCTNFVIAPQTAAGRAVEGKGWAVTGEAPLGPYQAVSFVGTFAAGTSGTCALSDGNVGIFLGEKLVAIVYAGTKSGGSIGRAMPFGTNGIRLFDGDYIQMPIADMRVAGASGLVVTPPAAEEPVCGTLRVPYIYGLPIDLARAMLAEDGWQPVDQKRAGTNTPGMADEIARLGVPEVADCSGTGMGFCAYDYRQGGASLSVTTAGEIGADGTMPWVVGYGRTCAAGQ